MSRPAGAQPIAGLSTAIEAGKRDRNKPLVVLIVSHGWTIRNYLLTRFLPALGRACRVVVCSPLAGDPEFEALCAGRTAGVIPMASFKKTWFHQRIASRRTLYHFAWSRTESMAIKKARATSWYGPVRNFRNRADHTIAGVLASPLALGVLDRLDAWCRLRSAAVAEYELLFHMLKPSAVVSTAPIIEAEWVPLYVAQRAGIKTAAAVLSWDNLTSKGRLPHGCDRYIVWTPQMAEHALQFHPELRPDQIAITGTAQFDAHRDPSLRVSREEFCRQMGLDPARKIIVYAGLTESLMPDEPALIEEIAQAVSAGRISGRPQFLVRPHPADGGRRYQGWREKHPDVALFVSGERAGGDVRKLVTSRDDLKVLINTLIHGDVHLNVASTMTIDAAVLDRPVVNVKFDAQSAKGRIPPGLELFGCTHYRPIVASGGVRVAHSLEDLVAHVNAYLNDPSLDREGRQRIVDMICGPLDGDGAGRIAGVVAELAGQPRGSVSTSPLLAWHRSGA